MVIKLFFDVILSLVSNEPCGVLLNLSDRQFVAMCFKFLRPLFEFCSSFLPSPINFPFKMLQFYGFWSSDNWNYSCKFYYRIYLCFIQFIITTVFIGQVLFLVNEKNIEIAILSGVLLIPAAGSYCRQLNLFFKKEQIADVENKIRDYEYLGHDNEQMKIKKYYYNRMGFMNYFIAMTLTLFGVIHSLSSWQGHHYPMPIWIPHEIDMNIPFWILFIYSSLSCWIHIVFIMSYDLIFSGHLTMLAMHLDILKYRFEIISQLNKLKRKTYLTQCIKYQQYIYELSNSIQSTFFISNSVCIFSVCISLCLGVFKLSIENLYSVNTWVSVQFILAVLVKWAIQCWEATIVMQKSIEISDAAYNLNWINFNKSTAISLMIIIRRSSMKPIIFYGILATPLSINTLKSVIKVSYNVYLLLKHVTNVLESA